FQHRRALGRPAVRDQRAGDAPLAPLGRRRRRRIQLLDEARGVGLAVRHRPPAGAEARRVRPQRRGLPQGLRRAAPLRVPPPVSYHRKMVVFSKNPQIAERQMQAVIVYLTTFGWIDGDFDLSEKLFVLEYIRSLVEMRVSQAGIDDPMLRLETINRYTTHFDMEFERVDTEIRSWFDEVVAGDENQTKFVHARMKLRCFEL